MIRKPTEEDFRESKTVTVLRETRRVSVEGGKGVAKGIGNAYLYFFGAMMGFGFIAPMLTFAASGSGGFIVIGILVGLVLVFVGIAKSDRRKLPERTSSPTAPPVPAASSRVVQQGMVRLDRAKLVSKAVMLIIPALIMFILPFGPPLQGLMTVAGVVMFALATMLVYRAFGETMVLEFDHRSVKATGLLGHGELLWADVDDIYVQTFKRLNLYALFSSGTRRNLVIAATRNRMDGPSRLLVPIDLIELDKEGLVQLVTDLLCCRAAGGEIVPSWQPQAAAARPAPAYQPGPASDPRESFDPDAIIARHLAEREQLIAETRPDQQGTMQPPVLRTFGRRLV